MKYDLILKFFFTVFLHIPDFSHTFHLVEFIFKIVKLSLII